MDILYIKLTNILFMPLLTFYYFVFQEVKLMRPSPEMKLGLTLCYEDDDIEGQTEIFIDDIHPQGLAAQDGRLQLGDQIVEVIKKHRQY